MTYVNLTKTQLRKVDDEEVHNREQKEDIKFHKFFKSKRTVCFILFINILILLFALFSELLNEKETLASCGKKRLQSDRKLIFYMLYSFFVIFQAILYSINECHLFLVSSIIIITVFLTIGITSLKAHQHGKFMNLHDMSSHTFCLLNTTASINLFLFLFRKEKKTVFIIDKFEVSKYFQKNINRNIIFSSLFFIFGIIEYIFEKSIMDNKDFKLLVFLFLLTTTIYFNVLDFLKLENISNNKEEFSIFFKKHIVINFALCVMAFVGVFFVEHFKYSSISAGSILLIGTLICLIMRDPEVKPNETESATT